MTTLPPKRKTQKPQSQLAQTAYALSPMLYGAVTSNGDMLEAARMLRRRFRLVVAMMGAGLLIGLLVSVMLRPLYRAETILMLDQRKTQVTDMSSVVSGLPGDNSALQSEIDIITSRAVIDRVINRLNLVDDPEFHVWRKKWIDWIDPTNWFEPSQNLTQDEATQRARSKAAKVILKRLKVENDGHSFSIKIAFDSREPQKSAQIANMFADEYLVDQLEAKYEVTARANKWLNERLGELRKQVEVSEKAVEEYRQKARLIEIDGSTISARQLEEINSQLVEARGQTSQAEARLRSAQSMVRSGGGFEAAADVLASPLIQRLREQEATLQRSVADLATRYGDRHPKMIKAQAEINDLHGKISGEVQKIIQALANEVTVARAKEQQLDRSLKDLESRAGVELKDSVRLRQLERDAEANRTLYNSFLTRFKQTSEQQGLQLADTRVIARAEPPVEHVFPKKWLFALIGAVSGILIGIFAAYLIEFFDRGFRSAPQVESKTGQSVIGIIPSLAGLTQKTPEDYVLAKPLSSYSEALRTVRTAIHFSDVDHPPKIVMVTSSIPGEGKTTFCLSLARSLAKAGNKILLIDADLRRPRIGKALGLEGKNGLAEILSGQATLKDVMQHDKALPALSIIAARGKAPNAQDLLGSQQMKKLIREVSADYDLVIIDTPPILAVTDAAVAAPVVDTTLFVVRWAETPRESVVQALNQMATYNCKIAGLVLTQVNMAEVASYGDGYHSYRYTEYYSN